MFILGKYCVKCCTLDITLEQNTAPIGKTVSPLRKSTASARESDILKRTVRSSRSSAYFTRTAVVCRGFIDPYCAANHVTETSKENHPNIAHR